MSPNSPASSVVASRPTLIIFGSCSRGPWAARRATSSRCRSAAFIIGWCTASAMKPPGGRMQESTQSRPPVSFGDKPGSMIRKITSRVSRCARRLDRSPRHLTIRANRGPSRSPLATRTTVERREQRRRPPQRRIGCSALSRKRRHRLCRSHYRRPPGTWPLRSKRFGAWLRQHYYERTWDAPSPATLNAALNVLEAQAQFDGPQRNVSVRLAEQDGLIYLDLADEALRRNRRQRMADRRGPCGQVPPQRWHAATSAPGAGRIN